MATPIKFKFFLEYFVTPIIFCKFASLNITIIMVKEIISLCFYGGFCYRCVYKFLKKQVLYLIYFVFLQFEFEIKNTQYVRQ